MENNGVENIGIAELSQAPELSVESLRSHIAVDRKEGRLVSRFPEQLRPHRALYGICWTAIVEAHEVARQKSPIPDPILITNKGTILAGFGQWKLALLDAPQQINCIEYALDDHEALQFMLAYHRTRQGWNAFIRIRLALILEPAMQEQALANMRAGGTHKGLAKLPEAQHIDVREDIARVAGVCARNVGKVKAILQNAHPRLLEALRDGTLSINQAAHLCRLSKSRQMEQFTRFTAERATNLVISGTISRLRESAIGLDATTLLSTLQLHEAKQPGSVTVRVTRRQRTIVLVGQDLLNVTVS